MKQVFHFMFVLGVSGFVLVAEGDQLRLATSDDCSKLHHTAQDDCVQEIGNRSLTSDHVSACAELAWHNHQFCIKEVGHTVNPERIVACKNFVDQSWESKKQRTCLTAVNTLSLDQISACSSYGDEHASSCVKKVVGHPSLDFRKLLACSSFGRPMACLNEVIEREESNSLPISLEYINACGVFQDYLQGSCLFIGADYSISVAQIKACGSSFKRYDPPSHFSDGISCLYISHQNKSLSPDYINSCGVFQEQEDDENYSTYGLQCLRKVAEIIEEFSISKLKWPRINRRSADIPHIISFEQVRGCGSFYMPNQLSCLETVTRLNLANKEMLTQAQIKACGSFYMRNQLSCLERIQEFPGILGEENINACGLIGTGEYGMQCLEKVGEFPDVLSSEHIRSCAFEFDEGPADRMQCLEKVVQFSDLLSSNEVKDCMESNNANNEISCLLNFAP